MLREGVSIGTIGVLRKNPQPFPSAEIRLVETFADQAVIAIENVRLFNETKEPLERQTATTEILQGDRQLASDMQPVFDTIVRHAADLVGGVYSHAFRFDGEKLHWSRTSTANQQS